MGTKMTWSQGWTGREVVCETDCLAALPSAVFSRPGSDVRETWGPDINGVVSSFRELAEW
jgi:hypothetical protein